LEIRQSIPSFGKIELNLFLQDPIMTPDLQTRSINTLRFLSADGVQKANSGHPGLPMGGAAMAYTIWTRHLRHNPRNPK
jgi:transketolase